MATLSAMFRLMDGYSTQINKMMNRTDAAMTKLLGASRAADKLNDSMTKAGKGAGGATPPIKGLGDGAGGAKPPIDSLGDGLDGLTRKSQRAESSIKKLIGTVASLAAVKKGMDLTDTYTNTNARLGMVTNSPEEQAALQEDVFEAANRSRGDYTEMANAAAKLRMLAGETFSGETGNQEAVAFTELLTKSLKVSGAGTAEQNSAFLQLTQAMTSGKLQGDEFRSIMENAPMVADAIATYMGKSKAELKELSSDGLITADIIKGAMFSAADDINAKFDSMPPTFADTWQRIKNAGMQAFGPIFERVNGMLNSDMGQAAVQNLTGAIFMAAEAANLFLDGVEMVGEHMDVIGPIVLGVAAAFGAYNAVLGVTKGLDMAAAAAKGIHTLATNAQAAAMTMQTGVTFSATVAQHGFNAALLACPLTWIIGLIILLVAGIYAGVAAFNHLAGESVSATGIVVGALFTAGAFVANLFIGINNLIAGLVIDLINLFISFGEFFANVLRDPIGAAARLFLDLGNFVLGVLESLAKAIDAIFGSNLASTVSGWSNAITDFKDSLAEDSPVTYKSYERITKSDSILMMDHINYGAAFDKGYQSGADLESSLSDSFSGLFSGFAPELSADGFDYSQFATAGNPATIEGTGKGGAVKVDDEEDIEWMRKLAERDYVARIAQNTLAPNIRVEFSGPITKEADTDSVMSHVVDQLKDIIAIAPEGVPG